MKKQKSYPMNGPSLRIQRLMEHPRRNRKELREWAKAHPEFRQETIAVAFLK